MAPFASMLKVRKGRKQRPITPPSPGSFVSPRSPSWNTPVSFEAQGERFRMVTQPILQTRKPKPSRAINANDTAINDGTESAAGPVAGSSTGPYTAAQLDAAKSDDALDQIASFSFPPTGNVAAAATTAAPTRTVQFLEPKKPKPPKPKFKVSLNLGNDSLEDMLFASGLMIEAADAPKEEADPTASHDSVTSTTSAKTISARARSATLPILVSEKSSNPSSVAPSSSIRRGPPRPIRIPGATPSRLPTIEVDEEALNATPVAPEPSSKPPAAPVDTAHLTPSNSKISPAKTSSSNSSPGSASAPTSGPSPRGRSGSSPASSTAETDADGTKKQHSRNSKPQPPLPMSPPFEVPTNPIQSLTAPETRTRPPRSTNPQAVPSTAVPAENIADLVSTTLARQSAMSTLTAFTMTSHVRSHSAVTDSHSISDASSSRTVLMNVNDLPFTPGFLSPAQRMSGDLMGRTRVDSATLPPDDGLKSRTPMSGAPPSAFMLTPATMRALNTPNTASSSRLASPSPSTPSKQETTRQKLARRSASANDVHQLVLKAARLMDQNQPSIPESVDDHHPSEGPDYEGEEIVMMLDIRDDKGKGKEVPLSAGVPSSARPHSRQFDAIPPRILIPQHSSTPGSANHSPSLGTPPVVSSPDTISTPRSAHNPSPLGATHPEGFDASRPRNGSVDSGVSSARSARSNGSAGEKELAKVMKGVQQPSPLTVVAESSPAPPLAAAASASPPLHRSRSTSNASPQFRSTNVPIIGTFTSVAGSQQPPTVTTTVPPGMTPLGHALRQRSSSKSIRPTVFNPPPQPVNNANSVAPLKVTKIVNTGPNSVAPSVSDPHTVLLRRRERSASDASPSSPRPTPARSVSVFELPSPIASTSQQGAQAAAPSSFSAALSRAFHTGLMRKRSDKSMKGKEVERVESPVQQKEERKGPPPAFTNLSASNDKRNTASQFPQTPRPFSITSSAEHHNTTTVPVLMVAPPSAATEPSSSRSPAPQPTPMSAPAPSAQSHSVSAARAAARAATALPISGSRKVRVASPGSATAPGPGPSSSASPSSASKPSPAKPAHTPTPRFESVPIPWKGVTLDAAKWTFTSKQLQNIVSTAIRQSAEGSAIRLLSPEVLDNQLPNETYRLELLREDIKARYKFQTRRRRLLLRSLNLYTDGSDPETAKRLTDELTESSETCDRLSQELFQVTDQLAQMAQITQRHNASALSMALRKLNTSFIKAKGESIDLQLQLAMLEAERDEAWSVAENVERELDHYKRKFGANAIDEDLLHSPNPHPPSSWSSRSPRSSRVSAARKTSVRASKASLRLSKRSTRSSTSSIRFVSVLPQSSASSSSGHGTSSRQDSSPKVPPVPALPLTRSVSEREPSAHSRRVSISGTPSTGTRAMLLAQNQLFEMLGIPHEDIGRAEGPRQRSSSDPSSPSSSVGQRRRRASMPSTLSLLESPSVIAAMLSLPSGND